MCGFTALFADQAWVQMLWPKIISSNKCGDVLPTFAVWCERKRGTYVFSETGRYFCTVKQVLTSSPYSGLVWEMLDHIG